MILTCPKCASRFTLPADMLAGGGRKVKCSSCGEVWFQEPDDQGEGAGDTPLADETTAQEPAVEKTSPEITDDTIVQDSLEEENSLEQEEEDEAPSEETLPPREDAEEEEEGGSDFASMLSAAEAREPEAAPDDEGDELVWRDSSAEDAEENDPARKRKLLGFALAGVVFLLTLALFLILHGPLSQGWPASQSIYRWFGYEMAVPGERLIFDGIKVNVTGSGFGGRVINVKGRVMNLSREDQDVPMIEAALRSESGEIISTWLITPPARHLEAESEMEFESRHETSEAGAEVKLRFVLNAGESESEHAKEHAPEEDHSKNVSEDGGNTPAH